LKRSLIFEAKGFVIWLKQMQFSATNTVSNNHEYTYKSIVPVLHSSFGTELEETIDSVSIDSRSLQNSESTLFFAILGLITMHMLILMI
jgi:hypothetical protein